MTGGVETEREMTEPEMVTDGQGRVASENPSSSLKLRTSLEFMGSWNCEDPTPTLVNLATFHSASKLLQE